MDRRHIASCPDTDQLAVQRGGPGPSIPEPSCSTGAWQLPFHVDLPAGPSQGAYGPGVTSAPASGLPGSFTVYNHR